MNPVRVTFVLTHPIQYYAPWFRHIATSCEQLDLTVIYATEPTAVQQGVDFGRAFLWDTPLRDGYRSIVVRPMRPTDRIDSAHFFGLDVPDIGRAIADTRPDVVVVTGWYSATLVRALVACRRLGFPTLWRGDTHAGVAPQGWRRPLWRLKTRWLLDRFDGYLSPGSLVRSYLAGFGVADYRIFDVAHGVDNEAFAARAARFQSAAEREAVRRKWGIAPDAFVPLFVGKLTDVKRPLDLIAGAALAAPCHVLVVGSGHLDSKVREEASRRGVALAMAGFLNQEALGRAYAAADCLVLPSGGETWGLVVNEALASGVPAIVSDRCGCAPDLITPQTGRVFETGNPASLAGALASLRSQLASGSLAQPCRDRAARSGFDVMTNALAVACRSVLPRSPHSTPASAAGTATVRILACCGQMVIVSGLERMAFSVLRAMRDRGAAVHCVVNSWENHRITRLAEEIGATWSAGPYWYPLSRKWTPPAVLRMLWEVARVSGDLLREARALRPTHVLLPDFKTVLRNAPALAWLRLRGVKVVMRLDNAPDPGTFYRVLWHYGVAPFVDRLVCNSPFTERELAAHGVPTGKVLAIPNAAPPRPSPWDAEATRLPGRVIYVGQIIPAKGVDLLIDAVELLRRRGRDVTLDIVGALDAWETPLERGYRQALRDRAETPALNGAVAFLGHREDVPALMSRASVHCCPSRPETREGFGLVVLEAKLAGLPSVVGYSGALPELIDHRENGWICDPVTADSIAEGLDFFLTDSPRLVRAGRRARESAAMYSQTRFDAAWQSVFAIDGADAHESFAR
jgi:glycosyltransferase involved in cell wall biosynthesis